MTRYGGRVALGSCLLVATVGVLTGPARAQTPPKPAAIVALGDSAISGEGQGPYEPGTDQPGNFCHRSLGALIHRTGLDVDASINLACSGADSANVLFGGEARYGEAPQNERLAAIVAQYDVEVVVLQVGANDEIAFSDTVLECVWHFALPFQRGCRNTVGPMLPSRVSAAMTRVGAVIEDVRNTLAGAGETDYELIVLSYASPVTEQVRRTSWTGRLLDGCPFQIADLAWGRTVAVPTIAAGVRGVAAVHGARYLDLSHATEGREACARGISASQQWVTPLNIDLGQLFNGVGINIVQQSFHPNAQGHAQIGGCLGQFVASGASTATCLRGTDGNLHPETLGVAAQSAPDAAAVIAAAERVDARHAAADARAARAAAAQASTG
jgi:lysophospholipase L1-like esterase